MLNFSICSILSLGLVAVTLGSNITFRENSNSCGSLYLTQSPYANKNLQLNWNFTCADPPDTIRLTYRNRRETILYKISPVPIVSGVQDSRTSMKGVRFPGGWEKHERNRNLDAKCFAYYISSESRGTEIFSQCLAIQPAWMSNSKLQILHSFGDLRIGNMMIPGTHNSGIYKGLLLRQKRKYVFTQDKNFWDQLVFGIRFFDIRIGRYQKFDPVLKQPTFYINHLFYRCSRLLPELKSVANFLKTSPKEVVILNFDMFPIPQPFLKSYHLELLKQIQTVFGPLIFPFDKVSHEKGPKLTEFWSSGQRLIVSYNDDDMVKEFPWLWTPVKRYWGNDQTVKGLEKYIKEVISKPISGNPMQVLMAELTPIFFTSNLKDEAAEVNPKLSDWLLENDNIDNVNIIATDFFAGNDMINLAIETNLKKLNKP